MHLFLATSSLGTRVSISIRRAASYSNSFLWPSKHSASLLNSHTYSNLNYFPRLYSRSGTMLLLTSLVTALIAPFVLSVPATASSKPKPPPGYQTVYNTCSSPANLYCCNGTGVAGGADEPTDTETGCMYTLPLFHALLSQSILR